MRFFIVEFDAGDEGLQIFKCQADDAMHATEQCRNAYPNVGSTVAYVETFTPLHRLEDG